MHEDVDLLWCVAGDFNAVLHSHEKEGGGAFNQRAGQSFAQCIFDCNLLDLGYKGPLFTWHSGALKEWLDRALGNTQWQSLLPNGSVINVPLLSSDHCGIWIRADGDASERDQHYFKLLGSWLEQADFEAQVKHAWRQSDSWNMNIARLTSRLIQWNQDVYGNLFKRKRRLLGRLEGIDRALFQGPNERFFQLKKELWTQYNSILDQEEAYWF